MTDLDEHYFELMDKSSKTAEIVRWLRDLQLTLAFDGEDWVLHYAGQQVGRGVMTLTLVRHLIAFKQATQHKGEYSKEGNIIPEIVREFLALWRWEHSPKIVTKGMTFPDAEQKYQGSMTCVVDRMMVGGAMWWVTLPNGDQEAYLASTILELKATEEE